MTVSTFIYPPGCQELDREADTPELVRRLTQIANSFQQMTQADEENIYTEYVPLALHLVDDFYIKNTSRDVQLLVACCIADILRIFAPDAPYSEPSQIHTIFLFLIKQLGGLKDPKDPAFKRYMYLLENLACVKSFTMCFDLDDYNKIFEVLFALIFKIINDEHSAKCIQFVHQILCPLIADNELVSDELLDIILQNVLQPNKSQNKIAYGVAKDLIIEANENLEPFVQQLLNNALVYGNCNSNLVVTKDIYNLIYEVHLICPRLVTSVMPQLEVKLKSKEELERLESVKILARMFSEPGSKLAAENESLWKTFLERFNDISVTIRIRCAQHIMHFLLNHPELVDDLTQTLRQRRYDMAEKVRYEVVIAIVTTLKKDFGVIARSEDLLNFLKERTLDRIFKIRKEAMSGLAMIYKEQLLHPSEVPEATKNAAKWIKDKILHTYIMSGIEDKLLVERLFNTCFFPPNFDTENRAKNLFQIYVTIDLNARKSFIDMFKNQMEVRKTICEFTECHSKPDSKERSEDIATKINTISKFLPDSIKVIHYVRKLSEHMLQDETMLELMEEVTNPELSYQDVLESNAAVLKKLGNPIKTNVYYNTIKSLLERCNCILMDRDSAFTLACLVDNSLQDGGINEEMGLQADTAKEFGLRLLFVTSFAFPSFIAQMETIQVILGLIRHRQDYVAPIVLSILYFFGDRYKPISDLFPTQYDILQKLCLEYLRMGTPKEAKWAMKCLFANTSKNRDEVFSSILEDVTANLDGEKNSIYMMGIVSLGHLAYLLPQQFAPQIKLLVARRIVKDLLMKDLTPARTGAETWANMEDLCLETQCKLESIKMIARWLLGLKNDDVSAKKSFRILNALIQNNGDLLEGGRPSPAERAWFRLRAGCAMLKICEQPGVGDQLLPEQFYNLASLMLDDVTEVKERFLCKLYKGLAKDDPKQSLPVNFTGIFILAGLDKGPRIRKIAKHFMVSEITRRRDMLKTLLLSEIDSSSIASVMPDYMLLFAIAILAHVPSFTNYKDVNQLKWAKEALTFVIEPLITSNDFSFCFYQEMLQKLKNSKDAAQPNDESLNFKIYALCDLSLDIILSKAKSFERRNQMEPVFPSKYFAAASEDPLHLNLTIYIPPELQSNKTKNALRLSTGAKDNQNKDNDMYSETIPAEMSSCIDSMLSTTDGEEETGPQPKRPRGVNFTQKSALETFPSGSSSAAPSNVCVSSSGGNS